MNKLFSNQKNEKGQGLVEYAIIIALVAIVVIGAMRVLGPRVSYTYNNINAALGADCDSLRAQMNETGDAWVAVYNVQGMNGVGTPEHNAYLDAADAWLTSVDDGSCSW